jgi:hypothetical protein
MNFYKKENSAHSKDRTQWWQLILILGFFVTAGVTITGCENTTGNEEENKSENTDEYYVKYEVNSETIYYGGKLDVTINTESNEAKTITIDQRKLWETTIGPVSKDFQAALKVVATEETHDKLKLSTKINVSKNDSPFALKKSDSSDKPRDSVELNYTIDY